MLKFTNLLMLFSGLVLAAACSSDSGGTATTSEITQSLSTVNSKLSAVSNLLGGTSTSASKGLIPEELEQRTAFSSNWTVGSAVPNLYNGSSYSIQQWFIDEFDETFQNSNGAFITFGGRLKNALDILCYLPALGIAVDSTNLPAPGSYTGTVTPTIAASCGGETITSSFSVDVTVTATTDTTLYDRFLSIALAGSTCPFKVYARMNSTAINVATAEDQTCDSRDQGSRSVFLHDKSTLESRFTYYSKAFSGFPSGFEVYRGYYNETNDEAYVVGYYGGDDNGDSTFDSGVSFTAVGKPTAGGTVAISAHTNFSGNPGPKGTYQACVNPTDMTITTDDSLACTVTGSDSATSHSALVQAIYNDAAFDTLVEVHGIGETTSVGFTNNSDMFSL